MVLRKYTEFHDWTRIGPGGFYKYLKILFERLFPGGNSFCKFVFCKDTILLLYSQDAFLSLFFIMARKYLCQEIKKFCELFVSSLLLCLLLG